MKEIEFKIQEILGRAALANDMEVPEDIQRFARVTKYLAIQLFIVCKNDKEALDNANMILKEAIDILK